MPFKGDKPYGTDGGMDSMLLDQTVQDVRVAEGGNHIAFLVVNGPVTLRQRSMIEDVVRTIGSKGETIVALLTRDDGVVIEADTRDINFTDGIALLYVAPNLVEIKIPASGISTAMLADAIVTAAKLADNSVSTAKIQNGAVTAAKISSLPAHAHSVMALGFNADITAQLDKSTDVQLYSSGVGLGGQTDVAYLVIATVRGWGALGTTANGNLYLEHSANGGATYTVVTNNSVQFDQGVDSSHTVAALITMSGANSNAIRFRYVRANGSVSFGSGNVVGMFIGGATV